MKERQGGFGEYQEGLRRHKWDRSVHGHEGTTEGTVNTVYVLSPRLRPGRRVVPSTSVASTLHVSGRVQSLLSLHPDPPFTPSSPSLSCSLLITFPLHLLVLSSLSVLAFVSS